MKRAKFFSLAMLMVLSICLSSCQEKQVENGAVKLDFELGDTGGLQLPLTENNEEIRLIAATNVPNVNDKLVMTKIREITGLNLQIDAFPSGTASEKLATLIATKKLPDIMGTGLTESLVTDLVLQGAMAPVEDYMDEMPNFKSIYVDRKENNWVFQSKVEADGKMYGMPAYDLSRDVNHGVLYRKDVFDKHNIPMWNSPDEFYSALKRLKELYPDSAPYSSKTQKTIFIDWSRSWGIVANNVYYDEGEKVWKFTNTDPKFKDMLDYMRKLYDEKLLDSEFLTMTEPTWTAKMVKADQAFTTFDWIGRLDQFMATASATVPEYDIRYANPIGPKQTLITLSKVGGSYYVAKSDKSGLAFKLLDFLLSPAGAQLATMGIEGETFVLDKQGMAKYIEFPEDAKVEIKDLEDKYGMFLLGMYIRFDRRSGYFKFTEREQEAQEYAKDPKRMEPEDPVLVFTSEEKTDISDIKVNLLKACEEFSTKYILTQETGEAAWNSWIKQAENMGSERLVEIYNAAQKRYDKN